MKVIEKYTPDGHSPQWKFQLGPESYETKDTPERAILIREQLKNEGGFEIMPAKQFPERWLSRMHPYHDFIKNTAAGLTDTTTEVYPDLFPGAGISLPRRVDNPLWGGIWCTDAVTPIMQKTYEVARASAECALTGAEMLSTGEEKVVYALCRPSGHHAGPRVFGGYCYFNNTAVAADYLSHYGRVATLDIDYHHGNGTQEFFQERKDVFTSSIHGDPEEEYPYFWGYADERGKGQGLGYNLNLPLPLKSGIELYLVAVDQVVAAINRFQPDYFIISAGFDTHELDPIGSFRLQTHDYPEIARRLASLNVPTLICQEGGYNIGVLGDCVLGFLKGF